MADRMKIFLEFLGNASSLKETMRQSRSAVSDFARGVKREAAELRRVYDSLGNRLVRLGLTAGAGFELWRSAQMDKALTQIGQTAGTADKEVANLRKDLFRLGKGSGQDVDNLREGFNVLIQTGLNMKEAKATLDGVNIAMAVTGAESRTLANGLTVAATAFQFDLAKPGEALLLLDKMTVAGRLGNAELQNLSDIFARVGVNAKAAGMSFDKTLGFIEALSMVERMPERLATLADSTLRLFTNLRYMSDAMKATKVSFFNKDGTRRDALEVLQDIKKKYDALRTDKERATFMQQAFGKADLDTMKGLRTLFQGDALKNIHVFSRKIGEAGGTLKRDMDAATSNLVDQTGRLKASLREAADEFAKPIKSVLADLIKWAMDTKKNGGLELSGKQMTGYATAGVLGTWALARYGGKAIDWLRKVPGGKLAGSAVDLLKSKAGTAAGIAEGKALQAATGIMPVFVVNWPGDTISKGQTALQTAGDVAAGAGGAAAMRRMALLATGGKLALAGLVGYGAGWLINKGAGSLSDLVSGGKYKGPGWLGEMFYDWRNKYSPAAQQGKQEVKNTINLNIQIDKDGRIITNSDDLSTHTEVRLGRGAFALQ